MEVPYKHLCVYKSTWVGIWSMTDFNISQLLINYLGKNVNKTQLAIREHAGYMYAMFNYFCFVLVPISSKRWQVSYFLCTAEI